MPYFFHYYDGYGYADSAHHINRLSIAMADVDSATFDIIDIEFFAVALAMPLFTLLSFAFQSSLISLSAYLN